MYIIEANPRAFVLSHLFKHIKNHINYAAKVMMGKEPKDIDFNPQKMGMQSKFQYFPLINFLKLIRNGPEMKLQRSHDLKDLKDPFFRKIYSERNLYLSK